MVEHIDSHWKESRERRDPASKTDKRFAAGVVELDLMLTITWCCAAHNPVVS